MADGLKRCSTCERELSVGKFHRRTASHDGLQPFCRGCARERARRYRRRYAEKNAKRDIRTETPEKHCDRCGEVKLSADFALKRSASDGLADVCAQCDSEVHRAYYEANRERIRACYPRKKPEELRESYRQRGAAISRVKTGLPRPDMVGDRNPMRRPEIAERFRGENSPRYTQVPTYGGLHDRLDAQRGLAATHRCKVCGLDALHWALLDTADAIIRDEQGRRYSLALSDYVPMCASCHFRYDRGSLTLNGQEVVAYG